MISFWCNKICSYFIGYVVFEECETAHEQEFDTHFNEFPEPWLLIVFTIHENVLLSEEYTLLGSLHEISNTSWDNECHYDCDWDYEHQGPFVFISATLKEDIISDLTEGSYKLKIIMIC